MLRILTFHYHDTTVGEKRMLPTYYIEADYTPVAVRIYAETAPSTGDAKIDIYDDGVSIFNNRTPRDYHPTTYKEETGVAVTAAVLGNGLNSEEYAEDFATITIDNGSWVHCNLVDAAAGKNFTVQFELFTDAEPLGEEE